MDKEHYEDPGLTENELLSAPDSSSPSLPSNIAAQRERRRMQCHKDGCDSPAEFDVYVHLHYGWHLVAVEHLKSTIKICGQHKKDAHDLITSDHNKRTISRELAKHGRLDIDWPNAMVEFVPCGEVPWNPERMMLI